MSAAPCPQNLVERASEWAVLSELLRGMERGAGATVCVRGQAGIGKSALLEATVEAARSRGWTTVRAQGEELESDFAFGVLRQLFEPVLARCSPDEEERLWRGRAELARPCIECDTVDEDPSSLQGIAHGTYWLAMNLAEERPVLIVVDDAHWADRASLRALRYAATRTTGLPIGIVIGHRPDRDVERTFDGVAATVQPEPLTECGVAALALSLDPDLDEQDVRRWFAYTGGNPLLVHELVRVGGDLTGDGAADVSATVRPRLARLSGAGRGLALAAAAAGDGSPWWLAARAAKIDDGEERELRRGDLIAAALVTGEDQVRFVHPAIRAAILAGSDPGELAELHRRIGRILLGTGAPVEIAAHHLAVTAPSGSAEVAATLTEAARHAQRAGDAPGAVAWLRRALLEEPEGQLRATITGRLAVAAAVAGEADWSMLHESHLRDVEDPVAAARSGLKVGRALMSRGDLSAATTVLRAALDATATADIGRTRLELLVALATVSRPGVTRTRLDADLEGELASDCAPPDAVTRTVLAHLAYDRALGAGPAGLVRDLARPAVMHPDVTAAEVLTNVSYPQAIRALWIADDAEGWAAGVERGLSAAEQLGNDRFFAHMVSFRAALRLVQGRVNDGRADAEAAVRVAGPEASVIHPPTVGLLALAQALQGCTADALATLDAFAPTDEMRDAAPYTFFLWARGSVRIAAGDTAGLDDLRDVLARQETSESTNPAVFPSALQIAEQIAATDPDEAWALLRAAEELVEAFGAPRPMAAAARVRAVLDPPSAVDLLRRAEGLLDGTPWALERIRVRVALGQALLRAGARSDARLPLHRALGEADGGGVVVFADVARGLLSAAGGRPRRTAVTGPASLTPGELEVVELAVEGLTNREIAARRFVTVKAVEYHLANAYRKLGVTGRAGLIDAMGR